MKYIIYKLYSKDCSECYIGKTSNISSRISNHRYNSKVKLDKKLYSTIEKYGGFENWNYDILEEGNIDNPFERENFYCNIYKPRLNTNKPNRKLKEYRIDNRFKYNQYMNNYIKNKNYFKKELKNYFYNSISDLKKI